MTRLLGLLLAATAITLAAAVNVPVSVTVDATQPTTPFVHKWKRSFGSGHAGELLCARIS